MKYKKLSDYILLRRIAKKDHDAFREFMRRYDLYIANVCWKTCKDESLTDIGAQMTRLRVWQAAGQFDGRSNVKSWLHIIAKNSVLEERRKEVRHTNKVERGEIPDLINIVTPELLLAEKEKHQAVRRAIAKLNGPKTAMALFYLADWSIVDIAAALKIERQAVKSRLNRGRGEVAGLLEDALRE